MPWLVSAVNLLVSLVVAVLVARVVTGHLALLVGPRRLHPLVTRAARHLHDWTEPFLAPIRSRLPDTGLPIDFSPLVAIILVDLAGRVLALLLSRVM